MRYPLELTHIDTAISFQHINHKNLLPKLNQLHVFKKYEQVVGRGLEYDLHEKKEQISHEGPDQLEYGVAFTHVLLLSRNI